MPKRSPWAAQRKAARRQLQLEHQFVDLPKPIRQAYMFRGRIRKQGMDRVPVEEMIGFLEANAQIAGKAIKDAGIGGSQKGERLARGHLHKLPAKAVGALFRIVLSKVIESSSKQYESLVLGRISDYLKARKIPVRTQADQDAFRSTVNDLAERKLFDSLRDPILLREFERTYLQMRKDFRMVDQGKAADEFNPIISTIAGRTRLTGNQKRILRKWVRQHYEEYVDARRKAFRALLGPDRLMPSDTALEAWPEQVKSLEAAFIERARKEVIVPWFPKTRKGEPLRAAFTGPKKEGTRAERLRAYVPGEKTRAARKKELQQLRYEAEITKRAFDSTQYALNQMDNQNPATGKLVRDLYYQRRLNPGTIVSLFTSGSLAQRIFTTALNSTDFAKRFDPKQIDVLARGIAYIGPVGRKIDGARRAFQSPQGPKIFEFLEKQGLIETQHGGGKIVYLRRHENLVQH